MIFLAGTSMGPEYYSYLGNALAKQGYIVAIPFVYPFMLLYGSYDTTKTVAKNIMATYINTKFFIGGHSQGGGAAMRFACEEEVLGAIFLSPLCYNAHNVENPNYDPFDENSQRYVLDENGEKVVQFDTLTDTTLPTLLLEASNDHVLSDEMKADALARMPKEFLHYVLTPASHMGFCYLEEIDESIGESHYVTFGKDGLDITEQDQKVQLEYTLTYILYFLQKTVADFA